MPIYEGYGLTETAPFASYNHRLKYIPGSIGTPVDLVEMRIVDSESGTPCTPGELGEIAIRGPNVMLGYWNRPEDTAAAIRNGWFHSGDLGRMDDDGYFYIVDRLKDMISIGGVKVFPAEVERVLLDHPVVREAAVVGFPDEILGEKVVAFVVPHKTDGADIDQLKLDLQRCCQEQLGDYKIPKIIALVDELPRNASGKILKRELRQRGLDAEPAGAAVANTTASPDTTPFLERLQRTHAKRRVHEMTQLIQTEVRDVLQHATQPAETDGFIEIGMDSLMIVDLCERVQIQVGSLVAVPAPLVFDHPRICDLATYLVQEIDKAGVDPSADAAEMSQSHSTAKSHSESNPVFNDVAAMSEREALNELMREVNP